LAREPAASPRLVADLAQEEGIPQKFLEAILLELKRRGLVDSRKGRGGGYFLRKSAEDITFGDVMRVLEGPLAAVPCVSQTAYARCVECTDEGTCGVRIAMKEVRDATAAILDRTTLAQVTDRSRRIASRRVTRRKTAPRSTRRTPR
jgi:Rrf2 family protein